MKPLMTVASSLWDTLFITLVAVNAWQRNWVWTILFIVLCGINNLLLHIDRDMHQ